MSQLLVSLPLDPATGAEWAYVLVADGHRVERQGRAPAALLPAPRGADAEVVGLVPPQALAWHRVALPAGAGPGSPRLRAALEGLLEEQLLDEPDALHFAVEPGARAGDTAWVAACDRGWLRAALQQLEAAGRPVGRIVPEFAPQAATLLHVVGAPEQPLAVATSPEGVLALPFGSAVLPLVPPDAQRHAEPAVAALAEQVLQQPVPLQQPAERWLRALQTRWDLAQFEFASSSRTRALRRLASGLTALRSGPQWRPVRWGAALLVATHLAGLNAWAWKERDALADKQAAVRDALRATFPQVKVILDAPVQMEREVAALRQVTGAASPRDLEAQLAALAAALPPGRAPASLQYANGELRVGGLGLAADEAAAAAARLRSRGLAATPQGDALVVTAEDVR